MAEFDAFSGHTHGEAVDPAADFLSREQDQLGEIGESFEFLGNGTTSEPTAVQSQPADSDAGLFSTEPIAAEEPVSNGVVSGMAAIAQADAFRQEPEKIRKWREEQAERLRIKDEEALVKQAEWKEAAQRELDEWYAKRQEQLDKTKENNQAAEDAFVKDRDETAPGDEWQKIGRMCEFNPKNAKNTKDVSRMRSMLLHLKQTPPIQRAARD